MSDDDLENDDLEVGDDETEEGLEAAAEDVACLLYTLTLPTNREV